MATLGTTMTTAGIVRRIDELGRIVIPKEMRRTMHLKEGDEMDTLQRRRAYASQVQQLRKRFAYNKVYS